MNAVMDITPTALMQIERASIDMQVATAHRYPRSITSFQSRALSMVTLDEETAESCLYRRPVGGGKFAEGKSIRMAEIVGACYGNLRVGTRIIEQTDRQVICQGVAHDLESNFLLTSEVIESTVKTDGNPYSERMRIVVAKAALSKARRDAIFQVVPAAMCKILEKAVRDLLFGDAKSLTERRDAAERYIGKISVGKDRVFAALKVNGIADIGADELVTLTGIRSAIKDGDVTVDEAFTEITVTEPIFSDKQSTETAKPDQTNTTDADRQKKINTLEVLLKHKEPEFSGRCDELGIEGDWKEAATEKLEELIHALQA